MKFVAELPGVLVPVSIVLMVTGLALNAKPSDVTFLFRRPALLLRSLIAMLLIVPVSASCLASIFSLTPPIAAAIVLMSICPVPPMLPTRQLKLGGRDEYVFGLLVTSALLSIAIVPFQMSILSAVFHKDAHIAPVAVAKIVGITVLVPMLLGILIRRCSSRLAENLSGPLSKIANLLLVVGIAILLIRIGPALWRLIGHGTLVSILAIVAVALLAGHALGGPNPGDRTALTLACAVRHPGIALAIAKIHFTDPRVAVAILLYLLVSLIATIPYTAWRKHDLHYSCAAASEF
jgi:bile acid:Na+ symporter, BASS family